MSKFVRVIANLYNDRKVDLNAPVAIFFLHPEVKYYLIANVTLHNLFTFNQLLYLFNLERLLVIYEYGLGM